MPKNGSFPALFAIVTRKVWKGKKTSRMEYAGGQMVAVNCRKQIDIKAVRSYAGGLFEEEKEENARTGNSR